MITFFLSYERANPQIFRVGDIVEAEFGLVAFKLRGDEYTLKPILYALVLLEGRFTDVSIHNMGDHA